MSGHSNNDLLCLRPPDQPQDLPDNEIDLPMVAPSPRAPITLRDGTPLCCWKTST